MKIVQANGQTCNKFWIYSNLIADCIEFKQKIAIWVPDISLQDFSNFKNSEFVSFPLYSKRLIKFFGYKKYINILNYLFLNKYALFLSKHIINLIPGLSFKTEDVGIVRSKFKHKHKDQLMEIFAPNPTIVNEVNNSLNQINGEFDLTIGIHIRHGDYEFFENGKYYYSLEEYKKLMFEIKNVFSDKKVLFLIASNANFSIDFFSELDCYSIKNSSPTKDIIGLSKCDYICGPPSTFSAWASLYKDIPLYFVENLKTPIRKENFNQIKKAWF